MTIQDCTFGFIDYLVEGSRARIACQFFRSGSDMHVRLDGAGVQPVITAVLASMKPEVLGSFPAVLARYKAEGKQLLQTPRFWNECLADGGGALKFFQVAHHMRLAGATAIDGLDAAAALAAQIRASETAAARGIYGMYAAHPRGDVDTTLGSDANAVMRLASPITWS